MREYREENICKNPSPAGRPFFDIDKLNELSKEGWKLAYVFPDERFLITHEVIKALFYREPE